MEFPISSIPRTDSSPGIQSRHLSRLDTMSLHQNLSPTQRITSQSFHRDSPYGEEASKPGSERPLQLPAEELLVAGAQLSIQPRILKLTKNEFYQWQQILGTYKKQMYTTLVSQHKQKK